MRTLNHIDPSQGRSVDAERAANEEDFRNRLFEDYGID